MQITLPESRKSTNILLKTDENQSTLLKIIEKYF